MPISLRQAGEDTLLASNISVNKTQHARLNLVSACRVTTCYLYFNLKYLEERSLRLARQTIKSNYMLFTRRTGNLENQNTEV